MYSSINPKWTRPCNIHYIFIQYNVHHYFYGKSTFSETFNDVKDAILLREKLIESIHPDNIRIEVFYDLKKEKS